MYGDSYFYQKRIALSKIITTRYILVLVSTRGTTGRYLNTVTGEYVQYMGICILSIIILLL